MLALVLLFGFVPLLWTLFPAALVAWAAGVALLARSAVWTRDEKLVGALAWPAGIGLPFGLARLLLGPAGPSIRDPLVLLAVMLPALALGVWLYRAGRRMAPV